MMDYAARRARLAAQMQAGSVAVLPTALYGVILFMAAIAYWCLQRAIIAEHGHDSRIALALGPDFKGKLSPVLYLAAIGLAFANEWLADAIYVAVAAMWFIPDRRIEARLTSES